MTRTEAMQLLNLSEGFTDKDLNNAYRKAAKINHPDLGGSAEMMTLLNQAKTFLSNPQNNKRMRVTHNGILDVVPR